TGAHRPPTLSPPPNGRIGGHVGEFRAHVVPQGVPVHPQLPGQTLHGAVLVAQLADRAPHRASCEPGTALDQVGYLLTDRGPRAGRLGAHPASAPPDQPHRGTKSGNIVQDSFLTPVAVRHQPARTAPLHGRGGFYGDHQPLMITNARGWVQARDTEELIAPGAVGRRRCKQARRVEQRRGPLADQLILSLLILPQGPDPYPAHRRVTPTPQQTPKSRISAHQGGPPRARRPCRSAESNTIT